MNNATRNESTCETTPSTIWKHEVECAAIAAGADPELVREQHGRLGLWWASGEPVWMAAESLTWMCKQRAIGLRADREIASLRQRIVAGKGG